MPAPPGAQTHDGFYLRLQAGFGVTNWSVRLPDRKDTVTGGMFGFNLALGGAVTRNVIIFGEYFMGVAPEPNVKSAGVEVNTMNQSFSESGFGTGLAYYFDNNLYLSGALRFFHLAQADNDYAEDINLTKWGAGFAIGLGKEWWASDDWGIGLGGTAFVGQAQDSDVTSSNWKGVSFLFAFSATYN